MMDGLGKSRSGSVALVTALLTPTIIVVVGTAVEVTQWTVIQQELQRNADLSAVAGVNEYITASDNQSAANAAADLAEMNGGGGGTARTWNANERTLSNSKIVVKIGSGIKNPDNPSVQVTISQDVPLTFTNAISTSRTKRLTATGLAELAKVKPCLLALGPSGGILSSGGTKVELQGCSARTNASINASTSGGALMQASAFYASGSIRGRISGLQKPNTEAMADPFAGDPVIQGAFNRLAQGGGAPATLSGNDKILPLRAGTYSSWNFSGNNNSVVLGAGTYYVHGSISLSGSVRLLGNNVTIITSGSISRSGSSLIRLSAATAAEPNGAIPGIVLAGNSTSSTSLSGSSETRLTGLVYFPNSSLTMSGTSAVENTTCLEIVVKSVIMSGSSNLESDCAAYGVPIFVDAVPVILSR